MFLPAIHKCISPGILPVKNGNYCCPQFKNKFYGAMEDAYYNAGVANIDTAYLLPTIVGYLTGSAAGGEPKPLTCRLDSLKGAVVDMLSSSLCSEVLLLQEKVLRCAQRLFPQPS